MRIARLLITLVLTFAAAGCGRFGSSDFFQSLDTNGDRSVDLQEWMSYYGPHDHPWEDCAGNDFEPADCNGDLVLTWPEYHSARFESDFCGDSQAHLTIYQKPKLDQASGRYAALPPACRINPSKLAQRPETAPASPGSALSICERFGGSVTE